MKRLPRKKKGLTFNPKIINVAILFIGFLAVIGAVLHSPIDIPQKPSPDLSPPLELASERTETFPLVEVDGHFLGRGFINGKSVYIFQTENHRTLSDLFILPTSDTTVVTNSPTNQLLVTLKIYEHPQFNSDIQEVETQTTTNTAYTIHLTHNNIKDYGVIEQKVNNRITFIPFFFFY